MNDRLDLCGSNESDSEQSHTWCFLKLEAIGLTERLDMDCEEETEKRLQEFCLEHWFQRIENKIY